MIKYKLIKNAKKIDNYLLGFKKTKKIFIIGPNEIWRDFGWKKN